jgi:hypothetical protein
VIIDEASMLTEEQLAATIDAIRPPSRLILVGDPRQLPPIGTGRPFVDIVQRLAPPEGAPTFPVVAAGYAELTIKRRQLGEERPDLVLAEWFSGRAGGPAGDAVWSDLEKNTSSPHLKLLQWNSESELERLLLDELKSELGLVGDEDETGFEQSLGGKSFKNAVYFNFSTKKEESVARKVEEWQILSPVDYRYEQELIAEDGSKRLPDFTIDDPASGLKVYWEHLGMLDRRKYRDDWKAKKEWYHSNGIKPHDEGGGANGVLVTSEDSPQTSNISTQTRRVLR